MFDRRVEKSLVEESNGRLGAAHEEELAAVSALLERRGINLERIIRQASRFSVAIPSWGLRQGGTRFGRFAPKSEPQSLEQKMFAAAMVNDFTGITPRISLHI